MRVKVPHAKADPQLLLRIQQSISPLPGIEKVTVNPATGSVLVEYDPELHEDFHSQLSDHAERADLFALKPPELMEADEIAAKIEAEAEFLAAHSETARSVVNFVKRLNEGVRLATDNAVDLKVLLPLGLAAYTFFRVDTEAVTPLWVTLVIFSFNSFVNLHHPGPGVKTDEQPVVSGETRDTQAERRKPASAALKQNQRA
jgi:cation transport ATPase